MCHIVKFIALLAFTFLVTPFLPYGYHIEVFTILIMAWLATR
jgi:hypothetical protein